MPNEQSRLSQSGSMRRANQVRWAWLVTTLTLAAALVAGSWVNYHGTIDAVATLNRGQADQLEFALRAVSGQGGSQLDSAILQQFFEDHQPSGLRYVAVLDPDGNVLLSAGQPIEALDPGRRLTDQELGAHPLQEVGPRLRASFPRPPLNIGPPRADSDYKTRRRGYAQVLEFDPIAPYHVARARQILILAGVGATILACASFLFWRTSQRYDDIRVRLEEQRRLTVLGEMSAVLAHEIRNPLASLKGHAQLLTERLPGDTPERRKADRIVDEAKRLEVLTSDLLDFARSGPMDIRSEDPAAVLRSAVENIGADKVEVDTTNAPALWQLDRPRFAHAVLGNLLQNATLAAPASRRPIARVFSDNGKLVFSVRDFGPGLPNREVDRIFDPFFTTRTNGTGLGLPVARRIVELHGGRLTAANAPDGGAEFRVELPNTSS